MLTEKLPLKKIAEQANVSPAMVSQILNGKGRASQQVRDKVVELLEENGYRPKLSRQPFFYILDLFAVEASGKTLNVLEQLSGLEQVFQENDLSLNVLFINSATISGKLEMICERNPGGVIINTDAPFLDKACRMLYQNKVPFVQIGYDTENTNFNSVVSDSFSGSYMATRHLLNKGHRRVAILRWFAGTAAVNSNKKYAGYITALSDFNIPVDLDLVKIYEFSQDETGWIPARDIVESLLALPDPPTAIFVENSFISLSLLYPLPGDNGVIPEYLSALEMVHFEDWSLQPVDDIVTQKLFYPDCSSTIVAIDWESIGREAAQLLINEAREFSIVPQNLRISPSLYRLNGNKRELILEKGGR